MVIESHVRSTLWREQVSCSHWSCDYPDSANREIKPVISVQAGSFWALISNITKSNMGSKGFWIPHFKCCLTRPLYFLFNLQQSPLCSGAWIMGSRFLLAPVLQTGNSSSDSYSTCGSTDLFLNCNCCLQKNTFHQARAEVVVITGLPSEQEEAAASWMLRLLPEMCTPV